MIKLAAGQPVGSTGRERRDRARCGAVLGAGFRLGAGWAGAGLPRCGLGRGEAVACTNAAGPAPLAEPAPPRCGLDGWLGFSRCADPGFVREGRRALVGAAPPGSLGCAPELVEPAPSRCGLEGWLGFSRRVRGSGVRRGGAARARGCGAPGVLTSRAGAGGTCAVTRRPTEHGPGAVNPAGPVQAPAAWARRSRSMVRRIRAITSSGCSAIWRGVNRSTR